MKKLLLISLLLFVSSIALGQYCGPYTSSAKIILSGKSFRVIEKLSFDNNDVDNFIRLTNCHDIVIRLNKFKNGRLKAIRLDGNCYNIRVDSNYFENTYGGLYVFQCNLGNISFNYNKGKNITGDASHINSFCQFNTCSGANFSMSYNSVDIAFGSGTNPNPGNGDTFNFGRTNGTALSPAKCWGNSIVGGGTNIGSLGFVGILAGDLGGSYQDIRNNILVNTGYMGIQQSGGSHIVITLNKIVGTYHVWSRAGITSANNGSGSPATNNEISHNEIYWIAGYSGIGVIPMPGAHVDTVYKPGGGVNTNAKPTGWSTNVVYPASVSHFPTPAIDVLPSPLVSACALPIFTYTPLTNTWVYGYTISTLTPVSSGGAITSFSVTPSLPSGIVLNTSNGQISGTAVQTHASANYSVIAVNGDGSDTAILTLQVNKAILGVVADSKSKFQGTANPALTVTYSTLNLSNFRNGDTPSSLTTQPTANTTATMGSPVGIFPITASGGVSSNYSFLYIPGVLLIKPNVSSPTHRIRGRSKVVRVN